MWPSVSQPLLTRGRVRSLRRAPSACTGDEISIGTGVTGTAAPWVIPWLVLLLGVAVVIGGFVVRAES